MLRVWHGEVPRGAHGDVEIEEPVLIPSPFASLMFHLKQKPIMKHSWYT